jgi:hypothetical protein
MLADDDGLAQLLDLVRGRQLGGIVDVHDRAVGAQHLVDHGGRAGDQSSRSYSRSSRSCTMSMCSRPRKPQRNPKPSAVGDFRLEMQAESFRRSFRERVAEVVVVVGVDRETSRRTRAADLFEARERLRPGRFSSVMVSPTGAPSISLMPAMTKPTSPVPALPRYGLGVKRPSLSTCDCGRWT